MLVTDVAESAPAVSPDGRWVAYASFVRGRHDVFVRPFPEMGSGGPWQVSSEGGQAPLWGPEGTNELYYYDSERDRIMAVSFQAGAGFAPGEPAELFTLSEVGAMAPEVAGYTWDMAADGRFLMAAAGPGRGPGRPRRVRRGAQLLRGAEAPHPRRVTRSAPLTMPGWRPAGRTAPGSSRTSGQAPVSQKTPWHSLLPQSSRWVARRIARLADSRCV